MYALTLLVLYLRFRGTLLLIHVYKWDKQFNTTPIIYGLNTYISKFIFTNGKRHYMAIYGNIWHYMAIYGLNTHISKFIFTNGTRPWHVFR